MMLEDLADAVDGDRLDPATVAADGGLGSQKGVVDGLLGRLERGLEEGRDGLGG